MSRKGPRRGVGAQESPAPRPFRPDWKPGITWGERLGEPECPYMRRWVLNFGRFGAIRLHHWYTGDDPRYVHDHPFDFWTLVLKGAYTDIAEIPCETCADWDASGLRHPRNHFKALCPVCLNQRIIGVRERMVPGTLRHRKAEHRHTVEVDPGGCWTLLASRGHRRKWGFWVDGEFVGVRAYFKRFGHHPCA